LAASPPSLPSRAPERYEDDGPPRNVRPHDVDAYGPSSPPLAERSGTEDEEALDTLARAKKTPTILRAVANNLDSVVDAKALVGIADHIDLWRDSLVPLVRSLRQRLAAAEQSLAFTKTDRDHADAMCREYLARAEAAERERDDALLAWRTATDDALQQRELRLIAERALDSAKQDTERERTRAAIAEDALHKIHFAIETGRHDYATWEYVMKLIEKAFAARSVTNALPSTSERKPLPKNETAG
jgi:hypothetical protein